MDMLIFSVNFLPKIDGFLMVFLAQGDPARCLLKWSPADGYTKYTVVGQCERSHHNVINGT